MKIVYKKYRFDEDIPVRSILKNKRLVKYFNRETSAGMVCLAELLAGMEIDTETAIYYDTGLIEYEDFGLDLIVKASEELGKFSQEAFIEKGMSSISPLTQFKILLNMPLCFFSIENNLTGDNAVVYSSASGLLNHALLSDSDGNILLGAGKVNADGSVESGFALLKQDEVVLLNGDYEGKEGIEIFRALNEGTENA